VKSPRPITAIETRIRTKSEVTKLFRKFHNRDMATPSIYGWSIGKATRVPLRLSGLEQGWKETLIVAL
jgi:hypothetical protein